MGMRMQSGVPRACHRDRGAGTGAGASAGARRWERGAQGAAGSDWEQVGERTARELSLALVWA